jgi:hypothetical protein
MVWCGILSYVIFILFCFILFYFIIRAHPLHLKWDNICNFLYNCRMAKCKGARIILCYIILYFVLFYSTLFCFILFYFIVLFIFKGHSTVKRIVIVIHIYGKHSNTNIW